MKSYICKRPINIVHEYNFTHERMSWSAAAEFCENWGGALASVKNGEEMAKLREMIKIDPLEPVWIGATDAEEEGKWTWTDGTPMTYSNWHCHEPNNWEGNEDCAVIFEGDKWNDWICDKPAAFICEKRESNAIAAQLAAELEQATADAAEAELLRIKALEEKVAAAAEARRLAEIKAEEEASKKLIADTKAANATTAREAADAELATAQADKESAQADLTAATQARKDAEADELAAQNDAADARDAAGVALADATTAENQLVIENGKRDSEVKKAEEAVAERTTAEKKANKAAEK